MAGRKKNLTLIGMAGAGKSTLGRIIASEIRFEFVDGDVEIEKSGLSLPQIIERKGEKGFLSIEENVLCSLKGDKKVFSPGGSCVYSEKAMKHLRKISFVIFIDVPYSIIKKRLDKDGVDKIVYNGNKSIKELYNERRRLYRRYAHLVIKLKNSKKSENLREVIAKIRKKISL